MLKDISQLDFNKRYTYADYLTWDFGEVVELIKGKIIAYKVNESLIHSFKFLPPGHDKTESDAETTVSYHLKESDGVVQLTLRHSGFKKKNQTYANVTGGWPWILSNLKTLLETGKSLQEK